MVLNDIFSNILKVVKPIIAKATNFQTFTINYVFLEQIT